MGNLKIKKETNASKYLLSIPKTAAKFGIGRETLYELVRSDPDLPYIQFGQIKKINIPLFEIYLDNLSRGNKNL